ncbi:MAG: efflux RND transporter permease subunit, partial [bacterium]|nr:efflux RND transporter permease subunit [bacterium]
MFLSNASTRRPVAMLCLIIGLALLGVNSFRKMGLELMPKMDMPFITVVTIYPGASPSQIETDIAKRIEDKVVSIEGLKHVSSACMENVCQTSLEFNLGVDVDIAATDVREKLDLIKADLPEDAEDPKILKFDINAKPVINLALTGDVALDELYDFADNTLRDRLTVLGGVADVDLVGGAEREVQVLLDRDALAGRGLSSMDVVQTVQNGVRKIPSGRVRDGAKELSVEFDGDFSSPEAIGELEIANLDGQRCYLRHVARIDMVTEELRQTASIDGRPCVAIKVVKKSDANAVRVVNRVREAMATLNDELPGGMELIWVTDDGTFTEAVNLSAWTNVGQGILLTAAILFLFLYNFRALLVVSVTMPLTIVIGLFFMHAAGFTLNSSTLIAVGMSVGILVTNSIVVLEAIVKRLDQSGDPKEAARLGSGEVATAVIASAGTNVVVLFPMAIMQTLVGLWIRPLALTMVFMTIVSLFISFTLTPILCSLLLKPKDKASRSPLARIERLWNRMFDAVTAAYRGMLRFTERHRWAAVLVILGTAGLFMHAMHVAGSLGSSMVTEPDRGELTVKLEFPTEYNLRTTAQRVARVEQQLSDLPELQHTLTTIGKVEGIIGQSSEGVHLAQVLLKFSERTQRELDIEDLSDEIRKRLTGMADCIVTVMLPSMIGGVSSDVQMEIDGTDLDTLDALALTSRDLVAAIPGVEEPDTTVRPGKPKLKVRPRRAVLADLGYPAVGLGLALRANIEGLEAGTFRRGDRNYDIVVKFAEKQGREQVGDFMFPGADGRPLVLASLGDIEETVSQVQITRKDKRRVSKLLANLGPKLPLGSAVNKIGAALDEKAGLPAGYGYTFTGQYEYMEEGQEGLAEAAIVAMVLVVL